MKVNEKILFGMARLNKVQLDKTGNTYTLYESVRDRIHNIPLASGSDEEVYWKMVQLNEEKNK